MKKLEKGMTIGYLQLPWKNRYKHQSFHDISVRDVYHDGKYVKLRATIAFGGVHTDWFSVKDIIECNYGEKILDKFV